MKYLVIAIALSGCSVFKPGCFIQDKLSNAVSAIVVEKLQCQDEAAVKADVLDAISKAGLCKVQTGLIADAICPIATRAVVSLVTDKAIPAEWKCSAQVVKDQLSSVLLDACRKIPVSQ